MLLWLNVNNYKAHSWYNMLLREKVKDRFCHKDMVLRDSMVDFPVLLTTQSTSGLF